LFLYIGIDPLVLLVARLGKVESVDDCAVVCGGVGTPVVVREILKPAQFNTGF
jgi:hypothetical protein